MNEEWKKFEQMMEAKDQEIHALNGGIYQLEVLREQFK